MNDKERRQAALENFKKDGEWLGSLIDAYVQGAEQAEEKTIEKACDWLYAHLYTRRDEQSPANHFVCSKQEMLTQTEFVEQFKQSIKGE